ncbi:unnamed protein product [Somion occarium]|uniref:Uncharacterized protein n=1 Tax=Somion occarium TaxID=3059160 RepID=A0ABP1DD64_9APHY
MSSEGSVGTTSVGSVSTITQSRTSSSSAKSNVSPKPSVNLTPHSILRSTSFNTLSPSSSSSSVTFAPLPEIGPRKRNASLQLGVGARSRMLRNRRIIMQQTALAAEEGEELQPHHLPPDVAATIRWTQGPPGDPGMAEDAVEDAFIALGKMMKSAGKGLWRRVSLKDLKEKDKDKDKEGDGESEGGGEDGSEGGGEGGSQDVREEKGRRKKDKKKTQECTDQNPEELKTSSNAQGVRKIKHAKSYPRRRRSTFDLAIPPPVRRSSSMEEEEGRVWEEEVSEEFRKRLSGIVEPKPPKDASSEVQSTVISVRTGTVEALASAKGKPRSPR